MDTWVRPTGLGQPPIHLVAQMNDWLNDAEAVVVGVGSGLSAAGGLDYTSSNLLHRWHPDAWAAGMQSLYEYQYSLWDPDVVGFDRFWGFWGRHIYLVRYALPVLRPYPLLRRWLMGKEVAFITTNVDGQLEKAGFAPAAIYDAQGNYDLNRCSAGCVTQRWYNERIICAMQEKIINGHLPEAAWPRCPWCGAPQQPAISHLPQVMGAKQRRFDAFLQRHRDQRLLFLELGVGYDTPQFIRFPFERWTAQWPGARLVRISFETEAAYEVPDAQAMFIKNDLGMVLESAVRHQGH